MVVLVITVFSAALTSNAALVFDGSTSFLNAKLECFGHSYNKRCAVNAAKWEAGPWVEVAPQKAIACIVNDAGSSCSCRNGRNTLTSLALGTSGNVSLAGIRSRPSSALRKSQPEQVPGCRGRDRNKAGF